MSEEIKWKCWQEMGVPLYASSDMKEKVRELVVGSTVWTKDFFGPVELTVESEEYGSSGNMGYCLAFEDTLDFIEGEVVTTKCWKNIGMINLKAISRLELYSETAT